MQATATITNDNSNSAKEFSIPFCISDGYTQTAYVAAVPGLHPELRFKFRPMLYEAREVIRELVNNRPASVYTKQIIKAVCARLVEWSAAKPDNTPLTINEKVVSELQPNLFQRIYGVVSGNDGGDIDPNSKPGANDELLSADAIAAIEGRPIGDVRQEANEKN